MEYYTRENDGYKMLSRIRKTLKIVSSIRQYRKEKNKISIQNVSNIQILHASINSSVTFCLLKFCRIYRLSLTTYLIL